jgi:metal iron transporter
MPHTLYLGSGLVQARLRDFDVKNSSYHEAMTTQTSVGIKLYRPSLSAIKSCMNYSIAELCITLFIVAIFVNSAILIIAASSLSEAAGDADLFGMYNLFVSSISQAAGTMFALALLFSGISAGIVATLAGQLVAEGAINWKIRPFYRRLATRSIAIIPGILIAAAEGRNGLAAALNGCNVVLSVALIGQGSERVETRNPTVSLKNNLPTAVGGWIIWVIIAAMNVATLVFLGLGVGGD